MHSETRVFRLFRISGDRGVEVYDVPEDKVLEYRVQDGKPALQVRQTVEVLIEQLSKSERRHLKEWLWSEAAI